MIAQNKAPDKAPQLATTAYNHRLMKPMPIRKLVLGYVGLERGGEMRKNARKLGRC